MVAPTRKLEAINAYSNDMGLRVLPIYGGMPYARQIRHVNKEVDVRVVTPGRLLDLIRNKSINLSHIQTGVLYKADEMLSMGFIDDLESIISAIPKIRLTAFSATSRKKLCRWQTGRGTISTR